MISYRDALARMLQAVEPPASEVIALGEASGRFLAKPVVAELDAPRADSSSMDGYAVRESDARTSEWLRVVGESAAGAPFTDPLQQDQAVRIFTGAHVPQGANCVVIQENATREGDRVRFADGFGPSRYIRKRGSDFSCGDIVLEQGTCLTPAALVAAAAADCARVAVASMPRLTIIATGDELVAPGEAGKQPHLKPDSASPGVTALATSYGAVVIGIRRSPDRLEALEELAEQALDSSDLVVTIGGASVGDRDLAKPMFEKWGLDLDFSRVAVKPGKPVWFGKVGSKLVLGLPGNPGSALVTARLFLAPLLTAMQGGDGAGAVITSPQIVASNLPPNGERETFTRARMGADGLLPVANQDSGAQAALGASDWLIRRTPSEGAVSAGATVLAMPF